MTRAERWLDVAVVVAGVALLAWVQYSIHYLDDGDSYFHVRAAAELAAHGVRKAFPATAFSTWRDAYSDKDFLFHLGLLPFAGQGRDLIASAKLAIVAFDAAVLGALGWALRRVGGRFAGLWIAGLLAYPPFFKYLLSCRPQLLSHVLVLVEVALLVRGQWKWLFAAAALHVWSHSSFMLVPVLAGLTVLADRLGRRPPRWRLLAAASLGVVVGALVHPYFPNDLGIAWQIVEVVRHAWGMSADIPAELFGAELFPLPREFYWTSAPVWAPALIGLAVAVASLKPRLDADGLALALFAALLLVLGALSSRFYPLFLTGCALVAGHSCGRLAAGRSPREILRGNRAAWAALVGLLACPLAAQASKPLFVLRRELARGVNEIAARDAVGFLAEHAVATDLVYHPTWREFSALWFFRPDGRYVVALDPVFFHRFDPARFAISVALLRGEAGDVHRALAQDFGARWIFLMKTPRNLRFARSLRGEPRIKLRFEDAYNEVHEVLP